MRNSIPNMTSELEDILRNTVIGDDGPGSILHDFQTALDFVDEVMPALTKSLLLPLNALQPLNLRLQRQIEHGLARPQQKSYPHISGLFLLLRASGIAVVDASGRKPLLDTDPLALQSWNRLNGDERYFALLESWLMRGDASIIGERSGRFELDAPFFMWAEFFRMLQQNDWYNDDWAERVRYRPSLPNLALMELFGLIAIEDGPTVEKKGWRIKDVQATRWGQALLALLWSKLADDWGFWEQLAQPDQIPSGVLQPFIQAYRPDWQQVLELPGQAFQPGSFVFKVSLEDNLWREIIIHDSSTLEDLSDAILHAFRFDHDHLYRFLYPTRFGVEAEVCHPYMEQTPSTVEVRIGDLPAKVGFHMIYNYDFGDNWLFDVLLERIDQPDEDADPYRIGERQGDAPEQYPSWE